MVWWSWSFGVIYVHDITPSSRLTANRRFASVLEIPAHTRGRVLARIYRAASHVAGTYNNIEPYMTACFLHFAPRKKKKEGGAVYIFFAFIARKCLGAAGLILPVPLDYSSPRGTDVPHSPVVLIGPWWPFSRNCFFPSFRVAVCRISECLLHFSIISFQIVVIYQSSSTLLQIDLK